MLGVDYIDGMKRAETEASQWLLMAAQDLKADVSAQAARHPVPPLRTVRKKAAIPSSPTAVPAPTRALRAYESAGDYQI